MTRIAKMGSLWNFSPKDEYEDSGQAMLCQVQDMMYAMIIVQGSGKGNRWCDPVEADERSNGQIYFTDEQWERMIGEHYNFVEVVAEQNWDRSINGDAVGS